MIAGTDFRAMEPTTVLFGDEVASEVCVLSETLISCKTPAHGPGSVQVVFKNKSEYSSLPGGFTYNNPPTVSGVTPTDGSVDGGTPITITGDYFTTTNDTSVTIGNSLAVNMVVIDATTITCVTPIHLAGEVDIEITNSNGSTVKIKGFRYHDAPVISSLTPNTGPLEGGSSITITGANYTNVVSSIVSFGGVSATNVIVLSPTTLTCTTPAHSVGVVDVSVANDFKSDTLLNGFTYEEQTSVISDLTYTKIGDQIQLSWTLSSAADQIVIYRGAGAIDTISGDSLSYSYTESQYGYFRFSVELMVGGIGVDSSDVLVNFGKSTWAPPSQGNVTGYYIYVAEAVGDPATALPYSKPSNFSYDVGSATEITLKSLYDANLIDGGKSYFIAVSTYYVENSQVLISSLTNCLNFDYHVDIAKP